MTEPPRQRVDFDLFAADYEDMLSEQLRFFSKSRSYFSAYKIHLLRKLLHGEPGRILDFGSGIGLSLPHLESCFPKSEIVATDISLASLKYISRSFPHIRTVTDQELDAEAPFDLVLVATVLHHVAPAQRPRLLSRLEKLIAPGGTLFVVEHNPLNPVTRHMVATCPFDADAVLLSRRETVTQIETHTSLACASSGYTLFFPQGLRWLRSIEPLMEWLPLGGQYYVLATHPH